MSELVSELVRGNAVCTLYSVKIRYRHIIATILTPGAKDVTWFVNFRRK